MQLAAIDGDSARLVELKQQAMAHAVSLHEAHAALFADAGASAEVLSRQAGDTRLPVAHAGCPPIPDGAPVDGFKCQGVPLHSSSRPCQRVNDTVGCRQLLSVSVCYSGAAERDPAGVTAADLQPPLSLHHGQLPDDGNTSSADWLMLPCHALLAKLVILLLQLLDKFKEMVTVYRTRDESVALYIGVAQVCLLMFTIVATLSIGWCVFLPAVSSLAVTKQRIGELVKRLPTKGVCRLGFSFVGACVLTVSATWQPIPYSCARSYCTLSPTGPAST